jgi:hypothetical protein
MMTLVRIFGENWHAVERDLLTLGYRREDIGTTKLTLWELISIVAASPPGTAVYHAETRKGVLTPEAQLMASSMGVQLPSNVVDSQQRSRSAGTPGHLSLESQPDYMGLKLEALPPDELLSRLAELRSKAQGSTDKVQTDKYDPWGAARRKQLAAGGVR